MVGLGQLIRSLALGVHSTRQSAIDLRAAIARKRAPAFPAWSIGTLQERASARYECRIGSHTEVDAQWRWTASSDGEIAIGGRNVTNRPPPHDFDGNYQYGLYDPNGRVWYLRYRQEF